MQALQAHASRERLSIKCAAAFAFAGLAAAAFCAWLGQGTVAGTIGGGTIVSVVTAFLAQRLKK